MTPESMLAIIVAERENELELLAPLKREQDSIHHWLRTHDADAVIAQLTKMKAVNNQIAKITHASKKDSYTYRCSKCNGRVILSETTLRKHLNGTVPFDDNTIGALDQLLCREHYINQKKCETAKLKKQEAIERLQRSIDGQYAVQALGVDRIRIIAADGTIYEGDVKQVKSEP